MGSCKDIHVRWLLLSKCVVRRDAELCSQLRRKVRQRRTMLRYAHMRTFAVRYT